MSLVRSPTDPLANAGIDKNVPSLRIGIAWLKMSEMS
jgi:hypothetical protein